MRALATFGAAAALVVLMIGEASAPVDASTGPIPLDCNRTCLENVINQYLTALVARNPSALPLSKDVKYTENDQVLEIGDGFLAQFKLGYYFIVQSIHNRRYTVVDQERGIVNSHCVFDRGTVHKGVLSNGKQFEFKGCNRPSSILVTEAFLIENGNIRRVEMVGTSVPYHMNSPWGGLSGN